MYMSCDKDNHVIIAIEDRIVQLVYQIKSLSGIQNTFLSFRQVFYYSRREVFNNKKKEQKYLLFLTEIRILSEV